jgi:hypothetical protein
MISYAQPSLIEWWFFKGEAVVMRSIRDAREKKTEWKEAILLAYNKSKYNASLFTFSCMLLIGVDYVKVNDEPQYRFR